MEAREDKRTRNFFEISAKIDIDTRLGAQAARQSTPPTVINTSRLCAHQQ